MLPNELELQGALRWAGGRIGVTSEWHCNVTLASSGETPFALPGQAIYFSGHRGLL